MQLLWYEIEFVNARCKTNKRQKHVWRYVPKLTKQNQEIWD